MASTMRGYPLFDSNLKMKTPSEKRMDPLGPHVKGSQVPPTVIEMIPGSQPSSLQLNASTPRTAFPSRQTIMFPNSLLVTAAVAISGVAASTDVYTYTDRSAAMSAVLKSMAAKSPSSHAQVRTSITVTGTAPAPRKTTVVVKTSKPASKTAKHTSPTKKGVKTTAPAKAKKVKGGR